MREHTLWMKNLSCSSGSVITPSQMLAGALRTSALVQAADWVSWHCFS